MGPRTDLDAVEKVNISCPYRESNVGCRARSPLLYRLSYPGSQNFKSKEPNSKKLLCICYTIDNNFVSVICKSSAYYMLGPSQLLEFDHLNSG
jgi:hypothetical protein